MSKRQFKAQASSSRVVSGSSFGGFGVQFSGSSLSYLAEQPDLSSIADANVVVAFKNLLKKDSTTKSKALEDLRLYVQAHPYEQNGGVEQPILEAWVKLYPRISIDNSRRVRELSHNLQFELLKSARKRMEKHIPDIVGSWLSGTFDRDRPVSKAASDGITSFLDTEEKILLFWRKCQRQIVEYARNALEETPQTLSDERTVNADDALAKYERVVGASLSLVTNLLAKLSQDDIVKHKDEYDAFISNEKSPWAFIANSDAFVRRTTGQLLLVCLEKRPELIEINLEVVSQAFIGEGLKSSQLGSALVFVQALTKLTVRYPDIWTSAYKGKRKPISRIRHFIEKGSQSGPPEYWQVLRILIQKLPSSIIPSDLDGQIEFLSSLRNGLSSRDEPRFNISAAWICYFAIVKQLLPALEDGTAVEKIISSEVLPVFEHFIHPTAEKSSWSVGSNKEVLVSAFQVCLSAEQRGSSQPLGAEWSRLAALLLQNMQISLPEQSKDFVKSQTAVSAEGHRWFELQAEILKSFKKGDLPETSAPFLRIVEESSSTIIAGALEVLSNRNGKPYGAAATLEAALRLVPHLITSSGPIKTSIESFVNTRLPKLVLSPSSSYLVAVLAATRTFLGQEQLFDAAWRSAVNEVLAVEHTPKKEEVLKALISYHFVSDLAVEISGLQSYLIDSASGALEGSTEAWNLIESAIIYRSLSTDTANQIIQILVDKLSITEPGYENALRALEMIVQKHPQILYKDETTAMVITTRLLTLTETGDATTVSRANDLKSFLVDPNSSSSATLNQSRSPILAIIQENLATAGSQSLSINTLVQQAETLLNDSEDNTSINVFPRIDEWSAALQPLLEKSVNPALALTNTLSGCVFLVHSSGEPAYVEATRDLSGYAVPFRMALYTAQLLRDQQRLQTLDLQQQVDILYLLYLTVEAANDQLSLLEANGLWASLDDPDVDAEVQDAIAAAHSTFTALLSQATSWRDDPLDQHSKIIHALVFKLLDSSKGDSTLAYIAARALSGILSTLAEVHGWQVSGGDDWLASLDILKTSTPNLFGAVAVLSGLGESLGSSKLVNNLSNRLVSDITGAKPDGDKTLGLLLLLNTSLAVFEPGNLPAAQNRLVFALKHITSWLDEEEKLGYQHYAEVTRCLLLLSPSLKDIYGSYWESIINSCINFWHTVRPGTTLDHILPALYSSLRLVVSLKTLEDANEDLTEALSESSKSFSKGLLELLKLPRREENQPWRILDELLSRQIRKIPLKELADLSEIYPLIASEFRLIQTASFDILHRAIPAAQQQISVDVLLDKRNAQLPEELLSLLLDAPSSREYLDDDVTPFTPSVRSYLLSWKLIFDSYVNASYKVRGDYTEQLKSENALTPLLAFIFEILGHSAGQPLNLDKTRLHAEHIRSYDIKAADAEPDDWNLQWLLVHLYYLCLKLAPNLVKTWWIDCKSKQTRIAVESWTERYFSPLVITDTLEEVATWAAQQETPSEDEKELIVKVSRKSREVYAGYEVDEMQMQIVVRLPAAYPLEGVKVDGVNRVAVSEKKWQSWLIVTQGVITFSNGSITDGLVTFRKNVVGTLKGHTECAICYSIVSSDKKMPDKRCQTCKNLFHSSCLFKWFASSNQSSCPLCRNPFNYGGDITSRARRRGGPEE